MRREGCRFGSRRAQEFFSPLELVEDFCHAVTHPDKGVIGLSRRLRFWLVEFDDPITAPGFSPPLTGILLPLFRQRWMVRRQVSPLERFPVPLDGGPVCARQGFCFPSFVLRLKQVPTNLFISPLFDSQP